jgi:hypothetical protein
VGSIPDFASSANGLHYSNNDWPKAPDKTLSTPFGAIRIGDASNGLCGGMAFAVRDLYEAHRTPPPATANPAPGSPAFDYVVDRLFDSFNLPSGVARYYEWMNLPGRDGPLGIAGLSRRTIATSMPVVRSTIDGGHPCPLGLVCVHSANPKDLGQNHQVLAWGYDDQGPTTVVRVYDCNHPDDDGVTITFDHTHPGGATEFAYSPADHQIRGFFPVTYSTRDPSPLFDDGSG